MAQLVDSDSFLQPTRDPNRLKKMMHKQAMFIDIEMATSFRQSGLDGGFNPTEKQKISRDQAELYQITNESEHFSGSALLL